jgi:hypothetical protein
VAPDQATQQGDDGAGALASRSHRRHRVPRSLPRRPGPTRHPLAPGRYRPRPHAGPAATAPRVARVRRVRAPRPSPHDRVPARAVPRAHRATRRPGAPHRRPAPAAGCQGRAPRPPDARKGRDDRHAGHDPEVASSADRSQAHASAEAGPRRPAGPHARHPRTDRAHGQGERRLGLRASRARSGSSATRLRCRRSPRH